MGKLNYTTRKISGAKAAQAVVKDVLKFLPSPAKRSLARDPHLEINLEGKLIGDNGFKETCDAITSVLSSGVANLHELNVAKNELTITGLLHLVPVLQHSSGIIRDLDLSGNNVAIVDRDDEEKWEIFLMAFKKVSGLRRVDFSDNPLGDRAIEIFSKVYIREKPICLSRIPREQLGHSDSDSEQGYDSDDWTEDTSMEPIYEMARKMSVRGNGTVMSRNSHSKSSNPNITPTKRSAKGSKQNTPEDWNIVKSSSRFKLHGLRSVPFIVFSNTGITDLGAHHLSCIVGGHPKPQRILMFFPSQKAAKLLTDKYNDPLYAGCNGIIYRPNELLTKNSDRLLAECEFLRDSSLAKNNESITTQRTITMSLKPGFAGRARRDSHSFLHLPDNATSTLATELGRLRMKVQIKVLEDSGVSKVQLWKTALQTLVVARATLLEAAPKKKFIYPSPLSDIPDEVNDHYIGLDDIGEYDVAPPLFPLSRDGHPKDLLQNDHLSDDRLQDHSDAISEYSSEPEIGIAVPVKITYAQVLVKTTGPRTVFAVKNKDKAKHNKENIPVPQVKVVKDEPDYVEVTNPKSLLDKDTAGQFQHLIGCRMDAPTTPSKAAKVPSFTPTPTRLQRKSISSPEQGGYWLRPGPMGDLPEFHRGKCPPGERYRLINPFEWSAPTPSPASATKPTPKSASKVGAHKASPKPAAKVDEEPALLGNLPFELWCRIVALAADPDNLLSERQVQFLCMWGKSRESLRKELQALGKLRHQQIWRVLDGATCTAYEEASASL